MIPISFNLCFNILVNQAVPGHMSHRGLLECFTVTVVLTYLFASPVCLTC